MNNALKLTADLIQRRDDMRRLLGANYDADVGFARHILRGYAAEGGFPLAKSALLLGEEMSRKGVDPSLIIAAFVDECEARC